jgi:hypothetical protein
MHDRQAGLASRLRWGPAAGSVERISKPMLGAVLRYRAWRSKELSSSIAWRNGCLIKSSPLDENDPKQLLTGVEISFASGTDKYQIHIWRS